jgi:hypothetical protein
MLTIVAPVKLVPLITTDVPLPPEAGAKKLIVGTKVKVKLEAEVAFSSGIPTIIVPLDPLPTVAVI